MSNKTGRVPASILIANRGEIAVRIARTCREMGIRSIGVYSEADAESIHVEACDEAGCLKGLPPGEAYLSSDRIIALAKECGAEAVHPGYGFLAENAAFARACGDAGLIFIGPHPDIIERLGDKIEAKEIAAAAGVPTVPGVADEASTEPDSNRDERLIKAAGALDYPLLVKASAGGGGRGMRIVEDASQLPEALAHARREARNAFGADHLLVERYITNPRHIEVQIFGDTHGQVVHLMERDCSIQRRHQKLIEEAPAPAITETTRQALHEAACSLARTAGYDNAGTVEFVLDAKTHEFFFLEINTRLQVEHPVTEAVLGIDLVAWQILVAAGRPLPLSQDDLQQNGWAIEARITAEDTLDGFRPQTGRLAHFVPPSGVGIRFDSGVANGSVVTPYYDSMLAKVIAHGPDRETAIRRLHVGLSSMRVLGIANNIAFIQHTLANELFQAGCHTTHLAETLAAELGRPDTSPGYASLLHAAVGVALSGKGRSHRANSPWSSLGSWRAGGNDAWAPRSSLVLQDDEDRIHRYWLRIVGRQIQMEEIRDEAASQISYEFSWSDDRLTIETVGKSENFVLHVDCTDGNRTTVHLEGRHGAASLTCLSGLQAWQGGRDASADNEQQVRAAGPGLIVSVAVEVGETVEAGTPLLTIESMKMLTTISSKQSGVVARIECAPDQAVAKGDLLVELAAVSGDQ